MICSDMMIEKQDVEVLISHLFMEVMFLSNSQVQTQTVYTTYYSDIDFNNDKQHLFCLS